MSSVEIIDLDLNQDASDSESQAGLITELSPFLNSLVTAHDRIEERIRQLEAIISSIRQRETTTTTTDLVGNTTTEAIPRESSVGTGDNIDLVSKALNMDKPNSVPAGFFDCNICLEKPKDPILTCCGHLFCWVCFYQLPLVYLNIKECPVCDGEVTDTGVIPIYGCDDKLKFKDCGVLLPPRPNANRVESIRQKIVNRASPVQETIDHIRRSIAFASFPSLVADDSMEMPSFPDGSFDFDSFVEIVVRRNRLRSSLLAQFGYSSTDSQPISFTLENATSSSSRDFTVPTRTQNPTEGVITSFTSSSSSGRIEDVDNGAH